MGLKTITIPFSQIKEDLYLRNDEKYHSFLFSSNWNLFNTINKNLVKLKDILVDDYNLFIYKDNEKYKGIPTGQKYLDEDGKIIDFQSVTSYDHPGRLKYKITCNNILLSSLKLAKAPALCFDNYDLSKYVFSNGFYVFNVRPNWNKKFILYILRTKKIKNILDNHIYRGIGISAFKKEDLLKIKIPLIPKNTQDIIVSQIEPLEIRIKQLKAEIQPPHNIINKVFAREFRFNLPKFYQLKNNKSYYLNFSCFGNNKDIRQSVKFHRQAGSFVYKELNKITSKKIKDFIDTPIILGKGISPKYYDSNGNYYYISMADIKNWQFESNDTKSVSEEFSAQNQNKAVSKNDILIARSGEGTIGKVALIEDDNLSGIFADFIMRIRLKNYNHLFAYYYFRTDYFQYLIEINKKGLGNNTNIFPSQIQEFPLIDIPLKQQQIIVDEIKSELDKQENIKKQIENERNKVDGIIENAVK